ncbi:MAG: transposase [Microcoleus sp.]
MEPTLTIVVKLEPTPEQCLKIEDTLQGFAGACNYANSKVDAKVTNKNTIQTLVYQEIRALFGLSSNLAVRVCARVAANRKTAKLKKKPVKKFAGTSADYDARIFDYREKDLTVSLTLLGGRERIKFHAANYQLGKLKGKKPTSAQLCKHKDGLFYIHIQVDNETPDPTDSDKVIGVDFGRREIAHTSTEKSWNGKQIQKVRDHFAQLRASLQEKASKGTRNSRRSIRRLLKRLSGSERRFQTWLNHCISAEIINEAKAINAVVAIEDLTGIREDTNKKPRHKTERRRSNSWAFYQLRQFLEYKGIRDGVRIVIVNPAYTSQTCHQCLHIGLRSDKKFGCTNCGWHGDADYNGAMMISLLGGAVSHPESSELSCPIQVA